MGARSALAAPETNAGRAATGVEFLLSAGGYVPMTYPTALAWLRRYVRTTADSHKEISRKLWTKCANAGDIYLGNYVGWYNVREETFVTETDAQASDFKDPVSGKPLKKMEEPSYFFKMSSYQARLIAHIEKHPEFIQPEARRREVLERLKVELTDLSISRTTFDWGIAVPGDEPGHVMYVWFDALSNYITGIGYDPLAKKPSAASANARYWPANVHVIGKDIIWFHCVIWPAVLMSAKLPLPKTILAHGFVHGADGRKMSKVRAHKSLPLQPCAVQLRASPLPAERRTGTAAAPVRMFDTCCGRSRSTTWSTRTRCSSASQSTPSDSSSCGTRLLGATSRSLRLHWPCVTTRSWQTRTAIW
jgi:hypothetical protein